MDKKPDRCAIEFASNSVYGFWGLWRHCMQSPETAQKALSGFGDERLSKLLTVVPERGTNARLKSDTIHQLIGQENITSFEALTVLMENNFDKGETEKFSPVLKEAYQAYSAFYSAHRPVIEQNLEAVDNAQTGYSPELEGLYRCFDIPSDKKCVCYLNPFPGEKCADGLSNPANVSMDYSLTKAEAEEHYITNSHILKRKASTPLHEATHFLFFNSLLKKDIEAEKNPETNKLLKHMILQFKAKAKDKETKPSPNDLKSFAVGAINEAFAACSSALYNDKTTGVPVANDNEWYHGWKEANDLARQMYPLFKEYVSAGKKFDAHFFSGLNIAIARDKIKQSHQCQAEAGKEEIKVSEKAGHEKVSLPSQELSGQIRQWKNARGEESR